jgi:hypothetical protein
LQPTGQPTDVPEWLPHKLLEACYRRPNYLDRYYSLNPNGTLGSKRVLLLLPSECRDGLPEEWLELIGESSTVVYRGSLIDEDELQYFEISLESASCE